MNGILLRQTRATPAELAAVLWSFIYFFSLLASYYVLRPIRDEMGLQLGPSVLQHLFTAVFAAMLLLVPLFGWLNRHVPRRRLLPWLYAFFIANLGGFFLLFQPGGVQLPGVARVFFVWAAVYNLFVISVFWSFMADLFDTQQAKRLYGFIAAGGTLGALTGPILTASLVGVLGARPLLLVSAALLGVSILAVLRLRHRARAFDARDADDGEHRTLEGGVWSGLVDVLGSPYLRGICLFLFSYALLSTFLYFLSAELLTKQVTDSTERTRLLAQIDLAVNLLTLVLQVGAFRALIVRFGTRFMLVALPAASVIGFAALAVAPTLAVLVAFGVVRRAGEYALSKPARETLFNALPAEQKYKAKNVIDTLVHRTGDTLSAWVFAGLRTLGLGAPQIAALSVGLAAAWCWNAWRLGTRAGRMQASLAAARPPG